MDTRKLMLQAYEIALKSENTRRQNGAVLVWHGEVVVEGWYHEPEFFNQPKGKTKVTIHAEVDLLLNSARYGVKTKGLTVITPQLPCYFCGMMMAQAGISHLIIHAPWACPSDQAWIQMQKSGITCDIFDEPIPEAPVLKGRVHEVVQSFDGSAFSSKANLNC